MSSLFPTINPMRNPANENDLENEPSSIATSFAPSISRMLGATKPSNVTSEYALSYKMTTSFFLANSTIGCSSSLVMTCPVGLEGKLMYIPFVRSVTFASSSDISILKSFSGEREYVTGTAPIIEAGPTNPGYPGSGTRSSSPSSSRASGKCPVPSLAPRRGNISSEEREMLKRERYQSFSDVSNSGVDP